MNNRLKTTVKEAFTEMRYHHLNNKAAQSLLQTIETERGKTSSKIKRLSMEYAHDVFGWKGYAPWLTVYAAIAGDFIEGWIPENYYGWVVIPRIKGLYGKISNARALTPQLFASEQLLDLAYYVNGLFLSTKMEVLNIESLKNCIFDNNHTIAYKSDISLQGRGIHFFNKDTFEIDEIYKIGNGVFQKYICQHGFFEAFMPHSVATIRITSVFEDNGNVTCRAAYLRIGRLSDTHIKSKTAIKIPVCLTTGELYEEGYLTNWQTVKCHPDTKTAFSGKVIPQFGKCIAYIIKLHKKIPYCRSIGWDIILDKNDEIQLIEWNGEHNDIKFSEATQGPCFADMGWENIWKK